MFKLFNKLARASQSIDITSIEANQNICRHESNTSDCSLVQQLKEKQAAKREIDDYIKAYENNAPHITCHLQKFFMALESYGFEMDYFHQSVDRLFRYNYAAVVIEKALHDLSIDDVNHLTSEIISLKQKAYVLEEKRESSKVLGQEIADIKDKLGIE